MNELLDILKEAMPKVDWENGEDLVDDGVIDSMDVVTIISEITDAYDIEIPSEEMEPENFNSAKAIYEMIQRLDRSMFFYRRCSWYGRRFQTRLFRGSFPCRFRRSRQIPCTGWRGG